MQETQRNPTILKGPTYSYIHSITTLPALLHLHDSFTSTTSHFDTALHFKTYPDSLNHKNTLLQYSIHTPGRSLLRELSDIFCNVEFEKYGDKKTFMNQLLIMPIFQKSAYDLVAITPETNRERDRLLENCYKIARQFKTLLQQHSPSYWADLTDPASGYPLFSPRGLSLYPDVDGAQRLLKYQTDLVGCCRILLHPKWGTKNYPATMFTNAPIGVVESVMCEMFPEVEDVEGVEEVGPVKSENVWVDGGLCGLRRGMSNCVSVGNN
ncbi:hypothetical protein HK098_002442 [Nowakowskiella sp. JEL0407]|nr:hypothetical protein HK098_002442 [Nowakowskiella sp. JEL0407]